MPLNKEMKQKSNTLLDVLKKGQYSFSTILIYILLKSSWLCVTITQQNWHIAAKHLLE